MISLTEIGCLMGVDFCDIINFDDKQCCRYDTSLWDSSFLVIITRHMV